MRFWKSLAAGVAAMVFTLNGAANDRACGEFFSRLPNVSWALCQAAQLQPSEGRSVRGRTIYTRDVQSVAPGLRVLVIGGIHGDELSSAAVALHWIRLAEGEAGQVHWRLIPGLNPDGFVDQ